MEKTKYWYFKEIWYCVVCGHTETIRERKHTPKPEDMGDRMKFNEYMCEDCKHR